MPRTVIEWKWEEAFDKWGFGDGDGPNFTCEVAGALQSKFGYVCKLDTWGSHNFMIMNVVDPKTQKCVYKRRPWDPKCHDQDDMEICGGRAYVKTTDSCNGWRIGYDDPRDYLPDEIVAYLDETFKDED